MKRVIFSAFVLLTVLFCSLSGETSLLTYNTSLTATGTNQTYSGNVVFNHWISSQVEEETWVDPPGKPPAKVQVIASIEYRGFGYFSGTITSSLGNITSHGATVGNFVIDESTGNAKIPQHTDTKHTYLFRTEPVTPPWHDEVYNPTFVGSVSSYKSYAWNGSATATAEGAAWMSSSSQTTGTSTSTSQGTSTGTETSAGTSETIGTGGVEGTVSSEVSASETQSQSSSTGTSTSESSGGQWDSVGATPINFRGC